MNLAVESTTALWLLAAVPVAWLVAWWSGILRRRHGLSSTLLRTSLISLLSLAIAGLSVTESTDKLAVFFVVDASHSAGRVGGSATPAQTFVEQALRARPDGDGAGIIVFGERPELERGVAPSSEVPPWSSNVDPNGTDIEAALRLAIASFPPNTQRRVVLVTDGVETKGRAVNQTAVAHKFGVPVDVVPLDTVTRGPDLIALRLEIPPNVQALEPFELRLQTRSPEATSGRVILTRNDLLMGEFSVRFEAGLDVVTIPQMIDEPGLYRYRAAVEVPSDLEVRNNEVQATTHVAGRPRILLLEGDGPRAAEPLATVLRADGRAVEVGSASELPDTLAEMAPYDAIILSDVPATGMTQVQLLAIQHFVTVLGRGLVMLGGDRSFGLGGFFMTPVEDVLPVKMTRQAQKKIPTEGIALVIDKSASMSNAGGRSRIELAKDAAVAVAELLSTRDEFGVVGFDGAASWVYPYQRLADKAEALGQIGTLRAGGGTDIYGALSLAMEAVKDGSASVKHIILLSDGIAERSDLPSLATHLRRQGITLSTVAIGSDSDRYTLETLARLGGGRSYETGNATTVPQIFTREIMLVSRAFVVEGEMTPRASDPSDILAALPSLPPLGGYVATSSKPAATVALVSPGGEPVLAHWRRGLGKALAFTSDAKNRWAAAWIERPGVFARFWNQALRWTIQDSGEGDLVLVTEFRGGRLSLVVDSLSDSEALIDGVETTARVVFPDGHSRSVELAQVAPGRYRARIDASEVGTYFVSVEQTLHGEQVRRAVREVSRSTSAEFAPTNTGPTVLPEIASKTGGLLGPSTTEVWRHPGTSPTVPHPLAPFLLGAAALLWLMDIALRRLGRPAA